MRRLTFFLKFYKTQKMRFLALVLIFAFAAAILSCSLLVYRNNDAYVRERIQVWSEENVLAEGDIQKAGDVFALMERVMTIFAFGSVLIAVWGCTSILFFQNISMQKSHAMLRIFGMQKKDIFIRAWVEGIIFGLFGSVFGIAGGYGLFVHLSRRLCDVEASIPIFSLELLQVLWAVMVVFVLIAFFGSYISGLYVYESSITAMLYGREGGKRKKTCSFYGILESALLYALLTALFFRNRAYVNWMLVLCGATLLLLFAAFYIVFRWMKKQRSKGKKALEKISGISLRFLYARSRRDAVLADTVSVGAVMICIALNILFGFSGVLRGAFSKNGGYTTVVTVPGIDGGGIVGDILDKNGYLYTMGYYKATGYSELGISIPKDATDGVEILLIEKQTDDNKNFQVEKGCFAAEGYSIYRCDLKMREDSDVFGKRLTYNKHIDLTGTMLNYGIVMNREDWVLGFDNTWDTIYLIDLDKEGELRLQELLKGEICEINTASSIVDELIKLLSDYWSVVVSTGAMLILVTGTFFYSMVRSDLLARKKEMYLYQIYGASRKKAFQVVYLEYVMIAWISSFCVLLICAIIGGTLYKIILASNYPLSAPAVLITVTAVTLFVLACCYIAQWINFIDEKMEIIRDE